MQDSLHKNTLKKKLQERGKISTSKGLSKESFFNIYFFRNNTYYYFEDRSIFKVRLPFPPFPKFPFQTRLSLSRTVLVRTAFRQSVSSLECLDTLSRPTSVAKTSHFHTYPPPLAAKPRGSPRPGSHPYRLLKYCRICLSRI